MDIVERFINYTKINTTTSRENGAKGIMPSSPNQMELAKLLEKELQDLGLKNIKRRENTITTALLPANTPNAPKIAFFAHLDTSMEQTNDTKAQITNYQGGDICLNQDLNIYLKESEFKELKNYIGDDIIHTDGTSLLGADDKAAIAAIMDMLEFFSKNPDIKHGDIYACFLPDEEQGLRGAKAFDINEIDADFGYCLDCCEIGEFIYENWNAGDCEVEFIGKSAHPMSAKGKLVNSLILAHKFISMLPNGEAPEYTENKEGYFWVKEIKGNNAKTILKMDVREFDDEKYKQRMQFLQNLCDSFKQLYGDDKINIKLSDRYKNVFNALKSTQSLPIKLALQAYENLNIKTKIIPMRGGYDGAVLSEKGLACPNIFTGAHNFHSIYEYLPVNSLKSASKVLQEIIILAGKEN
ncbi:peptidase T [Campylobacter insulaenigrae]|uniref:Peptidase T n=2 Tax=Campylobacter insulaenigrae TaxID=260714 RepID=A0A0A8H5S2_9BACT|nr:peptidase T [Campylobacter insulaenigrae]AJC88279.1 peptidase T [Campylobacter insulaenigrae NCTC 12927]MCR6572631.1 peptidase T [Campylobacter insulaenigrae]MCR6582258.1 peptidase T [Campylobacter insulaenigrae]MCR6588080.1 peptidase T [Campylobacter insulaenigrae]TWO27435.1 peptidase T [Campylobacter insulaenigrae]